MVKNLLSLCAFLLLCVGVGAQEPLRQEVEAEIGTLHAPMAVGHDPAASGGAFVHLPHPRTHDSTSVLPKETNGYVELTLEVEQTAVYTIEALTFWPHTAKPGVIGYGGSQNSLSYAVDGARRRLKLGNDRAFNVWKWRPLEPALLDTGTHTVRFYCREYHARLDKIRRSPAETFDVELPSPDPDLPAWVHYQLALRAELRGLVRDTIERDQGFNARDDQGVFLSYWIPYIRMTGDTDARRYVYQWRDVFLQAFRNDTDGYYHGFKEAGEMHHQTENCQRFLGHLWHLDRDDPSNLLAIEHAAEHVGNWVEGIPDWYDWQRHRFVSWWIGTKVVGVQQEWHKKAYGERDPARYSYKDAMRLINMVLSAYAATGRPRYLELAQDFVDHLGPAQERVGWPLASIAQFMESVLMDLFELTGEQRYLDWARASLRRSLPWALEQRRLAEELPRVWRYRRLSGDEQFDGVVAGYAKKMTDVHVPTIVFMALSDSKPELPIPGAFALAGQILDSEGCFAQAFRRAAEHVAGARRALATEREPFVDRGDHNRATWLLWYTLNGVYPLMGMRPGFWGQSVGAFDWQFGTDTAQGLPDGVAVLARRSGPRARSLELYNITPEAIMLTATTHDRVGCRTRVLPPDRGSVEIPRRDRDEADPSLIELRLPSRELVRVKVVIAESRPLTRE